MRYPEPRPVRRARKRAEEEARRQERRAEKAERRAAERRQESLSGPDLDARLRELGLTQDRRTGRDRRR